MHCIHLLTNKGTSDPSLDLSSWSVLPNTGPFLMIPLIKCNVHYIVISFMIRKTIYLDRVRDLRVAGDRDRRADLDLKINVFFTSHI